MSFPELLRAKFPRLTEEQVGILTAHFDLMIRWNRTINLTTVTDPAEAVERHYGESLFLAEYLGPGRVVDIGSGAGFPGLSVAVVRPDCLVTLVESHQRKSVFLKEASRGLRNVRVVAKRIEAVEEEFDWAISRAVSYEDLAGSLKRVAPRAALLTGSEAPPLELGFVWQRPIPLPGGANRLLRIGVSRETPAVSST